MSDIEERPADLIDQLGCREWQNAYLALFAGARSPARISPDGLHRCFGKAECEWVPLECYDRLAEMGLVTIRRETVPAPGSIWGEMVHLHWSITEKGFKAREDWWQRLSEHLAAEEDRP